MKKIVKKCSIKDPLGTGRMGVLIKVAEVIKPNFFKFPHLYNNFIAECEDHHKRQFKSCIGVSRTPDSHGFW